jgi:L-cysteate sulfo-lyase
LLFGLGCLGLEIDVLGINVYHPDPEHLKRRVARLLDNSIETFGVRGACSPRPIRINHAYFGEGYGQPAAETVQAIRSAAQLEGVLFDPVYSGKALAGLLDQINLGNFADRRDVVLIHTGGTTALHVYEHLFR